MKEADFMLDGSNVTDAGRLRPREPIFPRLFPTRVATAEGDPNDLAEPLLAREAQDITGAVAKRRREFTAGRACARRALAKLGLPDTAVPRNADRSPAWPEGIVGSIAHADAWCGAAVARSTDARGLGLDLERADRLKPALYPRIATPRELEWLRATDGDPTRRAALLFSAKECFFKCQYPLTRKYLGFHDVELEILSEGRFVVCACTTLRPEEIPPGRYVFVAGHVFTGMALSAFT